MRQNLRRRHAKLSEADSVDLEIVGDPAVVPLAMEDVLRLEAAAWKGEAGTAIISNPRVELFYRQFAKRAAALGYLKLAFLRVGGKRIAFNYLLEIDGVLFGLKTGYDPDYQSYSPGHMLRSMVLEDACARGCTEYDPRLLYHTKFNFLAALRHSSSRQR